MTDHILAGAVLAAMAAIAALDARRAIVDPRLVLALLAAAAAWRFLGSGEGADAVGSPWIDAALGAALGAAAVMIPIAIAMWRRRRWPLYPGDAMMLGAFGFLLGPLGLAWTMLLGSGFALLHRIWLQRRRGRPIRRGLVPLGPGMTAGAAVVFLCLHTGAVLAAESAPGPTPAAISASEIVPAPTSAAKIIPVTTERHPTAAIPATELAPAAARLPEEIAARDIEFELGDPVPFPALIGRLSNRANVAIEIEERPARIAGGAAILADPPPISLSHNGALDGLLDRIAARSGYDWSWRDGAIVFHRYWDVEQRAADADPAATSSTDSAPQTWTVDTAGHKTLRGVLESWAARAGWTLVWNAGRDYTLGADAAFRGGFLEAADLLLSAGATRRALAAHAYTANRHLVIGDAGGIRP